MASAVIRAGFVGEALSIEKAGGFVRRAYFALFVSEKSRVLVTFLLGIAAYILRDRIPYSKLLASLAAAICLGFAVAATPAFFGSPLLNMILGPALVCLTALLGVSKLPTPHPLADDHLTV